MFKTTSMVFRNLKGTKEEENIFNIMKRSINIKGGVKLKGKGRNNPYELMKYS